MEETRTTETDSTADDALKRRLVNRIAVAAVIVVGLLGSLAMIDSLNAPSAPPAKVAALPPKPEAALAVEPAKEASPAAPTEEAKPAGAAADAAGQPAVVARAEEKPVPEGSSSVGAPPLLPLPTEKPLTRPATGRAASLHPSLPAPPAARPDPAREIAARPAPARDLATAPAAARRAPASRPISGAVERQLALQLGVFGNLANAEDLRAKLELHGIPASIEARVHAGPFKTREEVEVARAKLKELGLDAGMLVTLKK